MKPNPREAQAPESYATFWEPVTEATPPIPAPKAPADTKPVTRECSRAPEETDPPRDERG